MSSLIYLPLPCEESLCVVIVPSEEDVIDVVLSPGQHHVEGVQDLVLGGVTNNVRVAVQHSQYEGDN